MRFPAQLNRLKAPNAPHRWHDRDEPQWGQKRCELWQVSFTVDGLIARQTCLQVKTELEERPLSVSQSDREKLQNCWGTGPLGCSNETICRGGVVTKSQNLPPGFWLATDQLKDRTPSGTSAYTPHFKFFSLQPHTLWVDGNTYNRLLQLS